MKFRANDILTQTHQTNFERLTNQYIEVDENGKISVLKNYENEPIDHHFTHLLMPGLTNAHSHGFQLMMRGKADNPADFKDWVDRYLYPSVETLSEEDLRKTLSHLFQLMLRNGITTLGEFHYFHHNSPRDFAFDTLMLEEAKASGIRLSLLQCAYDLGARDAQKRFHTSPDEFLGSLETIEKWLGENQLSNQWALSVAPHSLHGCSPELLRESVHWASARNLKWHIHLAEQNDDLSFSHKKFGKTPLFALNDILNDKTDHTACLVHACWLSEEEISFFNERGIHLIYNPFTNMYLGDGITQTSKMTFPHSKIALGTDSNNAFNMFTEAKLFESLQRVNRLEMGIIDSNTLLSSITSFGGDLLNLPVGKLQKGFFADFIEIDYSSVTNSSVAKDSIEETVNHLIFSGFDSSNIKARFIGGKEVKLRRI